MSVSCSAVSVDLVLASLGVRIIADLAVAGCSQLFRASHNSGHEIIKPNGVSSIYCLDLPRSIKRYARVERSFDTLTISDGIARSGDVSGGRRGPWKHSWLRNCDANSCSFSHPSSRQCHKSFKILHHQLEFLLQIMGVHVRAFTLSGELKGASTR